MTGPTSIEKPIPRTQVYDSNGDELAIAGPCGVDNENAANAICVLDGAHGPGELGGYSIVYVAADTQSKPGYPRGVVLVDDGVLVTNGLRISTGAYGNENTDNRDSDVQAQLVAANIRPADACVWTVRTALHRTTAGTFELTFDDCAHAPVNVTVELDGYDKFKWQRSH